MSKHFCCCIPVRFGVFIISLFSFLGASIVAASLWYTLAQQGHPNVVEIKSGMKVSFILAGVHTTIIAVVSFIGFIGAIIRKHGLVAFYSGFLWGALIVNVAVGGYNIYQIFKHASVDEQNCKDSLKDIFNNNGTHVAKQTCIDAPLAKGLAIGIFIVAMLFFLYGAIIVGRYVRQLREEGIWESGPAKHFTTAPRPESHPMPARSQPSEYEGANPYFPLQNSAKEPLQVQTGGYPYSDAAHSYGGDKV